MCLCVCVCVCVSEWVSESMNGGWGYSSLMLPDPSRAAPGILVTGLQTSNVYKFKSTKGSCGEKIPWKHMYSEIKWIF